jgi:hypothetical protein
MSLNTKADFTALMHKILGPLKPLYSDGGARLNLGDTGVTYAPDAIEMEAFSRPLWALVPFWAGGGVDADFEKIYKNGIINGTDPESCEYWGGFVDYDQRFVEMAALACGIIFTPEKLWNPLSDAQKQNLATWLDGINHHFIPECNWQFFMILVNLALKSVGMPYDAENTEKGLQKIESYYIGEGWYRDGAAPQRDYYIPWAFHYYCLIYAQLMQDEQPSRAKLFRDRAAEFAKQYIYWFADDGSALPYGRSLAYRFAQNSFFSVCVWAGLDALPLDVMKGIITRNFEWWLSKPIFDRDGILTIGYAYPNLLMAERYNAPGSPYWCMKSFILLGLPDDHPFWQAKAAPMPPFDPLMKCTCADMLIARQNGAVTAYTPGVNELYGHGNVPQKYAKFAYSTAFGFSVSRSNFVLNEACPDSMLAFEIDDNIFVRKRSDDFEILDDRILSKWTPFPNITVETEITPTADGHIRRHKIISEIECTAYDCGFAVERFRAGECSQNVQGGSAGVKNNKGGCAVICTSGTGEGGILTADPNTNVLAQNTFIPYIKYSVAKGTTEMETTVCTFVK